MIFLFQGPYSSAADQSALALGEFFPDATIVLSSWKADKEKFDTSLYSKCVFSNDPGPEFPDMLNGTPDNFVRQRRTVLEGLALCDEQIVLKLRTDTRVGNGIKNISKIEKLLIQTNCKFVCSTYGSIDFEKFPILFHFSDLIVAGFRSDMKKLWESSGYSPRHYQKLDLFWSKLRLSLTGFGCARLACEQRLWIGYSDVHDPEGFSYDAFDADLHAAHAKMLSLLRFFQPEEVGLFLPERVSSSSRSAKWFYSDEKAVTTSYQTARRKRYSIRNAKKYTKSVLAAVVLFWKFFVKNTGET